MPSIRERDIHLSLWEILKNTIVRDKFSYENFDFVDVKFEPSINGEPDLVVEAVEKGKAKRIPLLVIETKRKVPYRDPRFDPYSIEVIKQAAGYANDMGAPYFATCNGEIMVVFKTFTPGVPLIQRRMKQYKVFFEEEFARIILKELVRFELGVGKWLPLDDVFVERLRSFHRFITPFVYQALNEKLKEDKKFKDKYVRWLKSQMFEHSEKINEAIAEQIAYLLMNKIAFYKTLESQIVDVEIDKLTKIEATNGVDFSEKLQEKFKQLTKKADYEGVFSPTVLDRVPVPDRLVYHLNEFKEELDAYNLGKIQSDILGRVYEDLIPADERHRLGQYYTPPPIVELIVEMCVESPNDKVLDPGCGSGGFLVKAYHKLRDLKKKENPFRTDEDLHQEIPEQIYGIDINPFPAQLSSINLAVRNLKVRSRHINLLQSDFFKVKHSQAPLPEKFDVVVTNPPYTRQIEMEYKDKIREKALMYSDGTNINISAQAGIYIYFFTHSAKFLKDAGKMGYITSNTWLDVKYGEGLKRFFLDHFKINTIIEFDKRVFERASVNTCIAILERAERSEELRNANLVKFVRIKKPLEIVNLVSKIEQIESSYEDDEIRMITKKQGDLDPKEKWGVYLRAPMLYFKVVQHSKMTKLGKLAKIRRGLSTGADYYFYLDKEKIRMWDIESEYIKPVITRPQEIDYLDITQEDLQQWVLMVHEAKDELKRKNANVLRYLEHGEEMDVEIKKGVNKGSIVKGINKLQTVSSRAIWYDLRKRKPAPILFPKLKWERIPFLWNKAEAFVDDSVYEIKPESEEDTLPLLGILNSSITAFIVESESRAAPGEGALPTMVYETKALPILDLKQFSEKDRERISDIYVKMVDAVRKEDDSLQRELGLRLDSLIFENLGLGKKERNEMYRSLEHMGETRRERKEVEVLIETEEGWEPRKKRKKKRKIVEEKPSKRLDTWMER